MTVPRGWPLAATGRERDAYGQRGRNDDPSLLPGGRARLRLDDEPGFSRDARAVRAPRTASGGHAPAAAARARLTGGAAFRQHARDTEATTANGSAPIRTATSRIVDPAWQNATDGMEYPTLFTVGTRWWMPRGDTYLEDTVVHETGHQWWYGIVATNEFEDAWMDEGINQYANARVMAEEFPDGRRCCVCFGGFVPWVIEDVRWDRVMSGRATCPTTAAVPPSTSRRPRHSGIGLSRQGP